MRSLVLLTVLLASGASAQSGLSLGMGPATGLGGPATYTEVRGRVGLTSLLSIEPTLGYGVEAGRDVVDPFPCDRCGVSSSLGSGESASLTLGGVLALRAPEAMLPGPLAEAHMGLIAQWEEVSYSSGALRYGLEAGAAFQPTSGLTVGGTLQVVRLMRSRAYYDLAKPIGLVPMLRLGYTPEARDQQASGGPRRARYSLASGVATGFRAGAVQTEIRASAPVGAVLAFEPSVSFLAASDYDARPGCAPVVACDPIREEGASALMLGVGLAAHSGHFSAAGLPLADAYVGTSFYYVGSAGERAKEARLSLQVGAAVPVARGVALGAEIQASTYGTSDEARDQVSIAPMLRLVVGG